MTSGNTQGVRLLELLVQRKRLTEEQRDEVLDAQRQTGEPFGQVIVARGFMHEADMLQAVSAELGYQVVQLDAIDIDARAVQQVPSNVAKLQQVLPVAFADGVLTVVLADPFQVTVLDDLRLMMGCTVTGWLAVRQDVLAAIERAYPDDEALATDVMEGLEAQLAASAASQVSAGGMLDPERLAEDLPVVELLNRVMTAAIDQRASDIHFEPFERIYKIRYRIDGICYDVAQPPVSLSQAIASRIKVLANLDVAEARLPQDGRIMLSLADRSIDLRVSTLPTVFGESIVMRVLDQGTVSLSLDELGMPAHVREQVDQVIDRPNGIFLVTGPTGGGKTTTLYSCLRQVNGVERKLITTEDPVEYDIAGIIQVPINPKIELTFARCLRSILRQDPDIVMVGEIRDSETARIAIQASLTGHLVFSTLHTNDAPGAVTRLIDMDVEPFLIASTVRVVLAQRLIRRICESCRVAYEPEDQELKDLQLERQSINGQSFYRGQGCDACHDSGYRGRIGVFELFRLTEELRALVVERVQTSELKRVAKQQGMRTLRDDGVRLICEGATTVDEVLKATQGYL